MARFTLETENLIVRPFIMDDLDTIARIINDGFGEAPLTERREWLEWTVRNYIALDRLYQPPYGDYAIVLKSSRNTGSDTDPGIGSDLLIGSVGFVPAFGPFDTLPHFQSRLARPPSGFYTPEFGMYWVIDAAQRGKGYAAEAARAMIEYAFESLKLKRIIATTEYDNLNSQKVMQKVGMTIERNPSPEPPWFQVVGILENPQVSILTTTSATVQENVRNV